MVSLWWYISRASHRVINNPINYLWWSFVAKIINGSFLTIVENATFQDFYSRHAPILLYFPCSYFSKIVSWESPKHPISRLYFILECVNSWLHWSKSGKLSISCSFSCSNFTISFVKKQIVWKLILQKLIVKFK